MDGFVLIDTFISVGGIFYDACVFNSSDVASRPLFANRYIRANRESIAYCAMLSRPHHSIDYLDCPFAYPICFITKCECRASIAQ
jgi:hypothetical protein